MKRTALMRRSSMRRSTKPMSAVGRRAKSMRQGKVAPNIEEEDWMDFAASFGCIVCHNIGYPGTPCAVHHIIEGGRRKGHLFTIGLCDPGHHQNGADGKISRHPNKARFEAAYGTEEELLLQLQELRRDE